MKTLAYYKARQVRIRNCIAKIDHEKHQHFWYVLWADYKLTKYIIDDIERNILVRRLEQ